MIIDSFKGRYVHEEGYLHGAACSSSVLLLVHSNVPPVAPADQSANATQRNKVHSQNEKLAQNSKTPAVRPSLTINNESIAHKTN